HLAEARHIGAHHVVAGATHLLGGLQAARVDALHDLGEALLGVLEAPGVAAGVLLHLERAGRHAAGVRGLARPERDVGLAEHGDGLRGAGHVRPLGHGLHAVLDQGACGLDVELVLSGSGQDDVRRDVPDAAAPDEAGPAAAALGVLVDAAALDLLDLLQQLEVDAVLVDDVSRGVRRGHGHPAELGDLLDRVQGDVPRAGDDHTATVHGGAAGPQHLVGEDRRAVTGGLLTHEGAAPVQALAGEHPRLVAIGQALVLTEQEADLASAHADVTGGDVRVLAHVAVQLGHERLAEPHHLAVAAAVRIEVGAALAAADGQAGQRVLEDLLEAEELHDAEVHRGVEPQTALVRAERGVVLDAETAVDLHGALVVDPGDAEDDLALRLAQTHQDAVVLVLGVQGLDHLERLEHLPDSLVELGFSGVAVEYLVIGRLERRVEH